MAVTCLMKGMGIFGGEDPAVVRRIVRAEYEWGHLAVFPERLRKQLAVYLGLMPEYDRYLAAWRACGLPERELSALGACTVEQHRVLAVSPFGSGGSVLGRILATGERVDGCIVMGDPNVEYRFEPDMLLKAAIGSDLGEFIPEIAAGQFIGPDISADAVDVVAVTGSGLMDAVVADKVDESLEAFVDDLVRAGLPLEAVGALRAVLSNEAGVSLQERDMAPGKYHGEWREYLGEDTQFGYVDGLVVKDHARDLSDTARVLRSRLMSALARDGAFDTSWRGHEDAVSRDGTGEDALVAGSRAGGLGQRACENGREDCHSLLTVDRLSGGCVTWRDLVLSGKLKPDAELARYTVWPVGPDRWHVGTATSGVSALAAVMSVRRGIRQGIGSVVMGGKLAGLDDLVGASSEYARLLQSRLPALAGVDHVDVDRAGIKDVIQPLVHMDDDTRREARILKPMGDLILSYVIARRTLRMSAVVEQYTHAREVFQSDKYIAGKLAASDMAAVFPGVGSLAVPRIGGQIVKATIAVLHETFGMAAAEQYIDALGLLDAE